MLDAVDRFRDRWATSPRRRSLLAGFRSTPTASKPTFYGPLLAEDGLRAALRQHHEWMLRQTDEDEHGIVPADAYQESDLCADTMHLLGQPVTAWAPISPSLPSRVKEMQYAVAFNCDLDAMRTKLTFLLADVRQAVASMRPMGAGMPPKKLRAMRDGVDAIAQHLEACGEAMEGDASTKFLADSALLGRVVDLFDETLNPVEAVKT